MYWSRRGNVWLRGRCELALIVSVWRVRAFWGTNGDGAVPDSGVKNGDVGLSGPGEKDDDGAVSVKALLSELVL